jgi:hypothetical protein
MDKPFTGSVAGAALQPLPRQSSSRVKNRQGDTEGLAREGRSTRLEGFARRWVENQAPIQIPILIEHEIEIKEVRVRSSERVERMVADLSPLPLVLY